MRLVIATCSVDYEGRLTAHLPEATRLLMVKRDGSISIHADDRAYKPLNWMTPPCVLREEPGRWTITNPKGESLVVTMVTIHADTVHELGEEPGLAKDGVEADLQELLAANPGEIEPGLRLIRREHPTDIGPVDLLCTDAAGGTVAVEVKRHADIDGVEQLDRYLTRLAQDVRLRPLRGILVAQVVRPQARTLAEQRGIRCVVVDYDRLRGMDGPELRLF
jgi:RecB family endonuclease NucS